MDGHGVVRAVRERASPDRTAQPFNFDLGRMLGVCRASQWGDVEVKQLLEAGVVSVVVLDGAEGDQASSLIAARPSMRARPPQLTW